MLQHIHTILIETEKSNRNFDEFFLFIYAVGAASIYWLQQAFKQGSI